MNLFESTPLFGGVRVQKSGGLCLGLPTLPHIAPGLISPVGSRPLLAYTVPVLHLLWAVLITSACLYAAATGHTDALAPALSDTAKSTVDLCLLLLGNMALWMGLFGILERAGLIGRLSRAVAPLLKPLFPDLPPQSPAYAAISLNLTANLLGLGNAATPFGLLAMRELARRTGRAPVASNAMVTFLMLNTAGLQLLPTDVLSLRAAAHSSAPGAIVLPSLVATLASAALAAVLALLLRRIWPGEPAPVDVGETAGEVAVESAPVMGVRWLWWAVPAVWLLLLLWGRDNQPWTARIASWALPGVVLLIVTVGLVRRVPLVSAFADGARASVPLLGGIAPTLLALLLAIGLFRASGALEGLSRLLSPLLDACGVPVEVLPLLLVRPLSGSASKAVLLDLFSHHGVDSAAGFAASLISGSSETTFYVLAVYFGAAGVTRMRHALVGCLVSDLAGSAIAIATAAWFWRTAALA